MQAAIALCYFCENHGPRIILISQPLRDKFETINEINDRIIHKDLISNPTHHDIEINLDSDFDVRTKCNFGASSIEMDVTGSKDVRCAACISFGENIGILLNDQESETSFISTQMPVNERLNRIMKQACLKSLTVEIPGLYIPMDEIVSHSQPSTSQNQLEQDEDSSDDDLSCIDDLKEGVVFFGNDKDAYTLSYTFRLKDAKARGFHRTYGLIVVSRDKMFILNNYHFFLQGFHKIITELKAKSDEFYANEQGEGSELRLASNVSRMSFLPQQFMPNFSLDTSRSLTVIANADNVFIDIHRQLTELLREKLPPRIQEFTTSRLSDQDALCLAELDESRDETADLEKAFSTQQDAAFHLQNFRQITSRLKDKSSSNLDLMTLFIWHIIIGGQLLVKCDFAPIRRLFLLSLIHFIPIGCIRMAHSSSSYLPAHEYNLLGCSSSVCVPDELKDQVFVVNLSLRNGIKGEALEDFEINVEAFPLINGAEPAFLKRCLSILNDAKIDELALGTLLRNARSEWLNNAKLFYQLGHLKGPLVNVDAVIRIISCKLEDLPVLKFWQSGLSQRYKESILAMATDDKKEDSQCSKQCP